MKISESSIPFRLRPALAASTAALLCSVALGCSTGTGAGSDTGTAAPVLAPVQSGFLTDYTQLKATEQFADVKMYRDDDHLKGGFRKVLFQPVQVWRGADHQLEEIPASDLQYLADAFYRAMVQPLRDDFEMVDKPGPGVLEISMAFTLVLKPKEQVDFFSANVPVPQELDRKLPMGQATREFVRDCAVEIEFAESAPSTAKAVAGKPTKAKRIVRAAFLDDRRGSETPKGNVKTWADLDNVLAKWSEGLDDQLVALKDGTFKPKFTVDGASVSTPSK